MMTSHKYSGGDKKAFYWTSLKRGGTTSVPCIDRYFRNMIYTRFVPLLKVGQI